MASAPRALQRTGHFARWLLPRLWLVVPLGLTVYSLTEPWARARIVLFWGITRNPGALALVLSSAVAMLVAGVAVAGRRRSRLLAACVHFASGALMCAVSWRAYEMVQEAGVKALGFIPIASVRPGPGLRAFLGAGLVVLAVGVGQLVAVFVLARRNRRSRREPAGCVPVGSASVAGTHVGA